MKAFISIAGIFMTAVIFVGFCLSTAASANEILTSLPENLPEKSGGIVNGDFSDGIDGWTVTNTENVSAADGILNISGGEIKISQTVADIENGIYDLTAYVSNSDISGICYLYGKTEGHTIASTAAAVSSDLQRIVVPGIVVENGRCDIGLYYNGSSSVKLDNFSLSRSSGSRVHFLKGGEISKLTYIEDMGGEFYRGDGRCGDALQIMAENGFNLARIRILNDPGKGHGDGYYYLPEGYQNEQDCLELARRAKDKGMKILFSFAYSDTWSDAANQFIPHEWNEFITKNNLIGEAMYEYLENSVYEYTKDIMHKLIIQGTCPEFVSLGNEMQLGLFFGNYKNAVDKSLYNNPANLARFLNAGARAVRETSPETKIVLHTDNGGKVYKRSVFIKTLRLVDFDVIGVSYYPFYDKDISIDTVTAEFERLITEFDKDVIIMETGYNWTPNKPDGWKGQLGDSGYYTDIYGETQNGQRAFLTELYSKLKQVSGGRCIGDLYWDPVMIYDGGTGKIGWAISEEYDAVQGNVVSNSTIFDFSGKAVEGQKAMKYNTDACDNINIHGKVSNKDAILSNTDITFTVNGRKYNVRTDKFGEYIVSVPYPKKEKFEITAKGCTEYYNVDAPDDGVFINDIDFSTFTDGTNPDILKPALPPVNYISSVKGNLSKDGVLKFSADYLADNNNSVFYTAVYNEKGEFIGCKSGKSGEFDLENDGSYIIKTFLWDDKMHPLCKAEKRYIEAGY